MEQRFGLWLIRQSVIKEHPAGVLIPKEVHGSNIVWAEDMATKPREADGVALKTPGRTVGITTADCLPLIILSERVALALHVSRKTLVAGLLENVPAHINPNSIMQVYVGPHICLDHFIFEHKGTGVTDFEKKFPEAVQVDGAVHLLSLRKAVQRYFDEWNVAAASVSESNECTVEAPKLPSYKQARPLQHHVLTSLSLLTDA